MKTLRRFRRLCQVLLVTAVAGGFMLNTWVNPWRVTEMPWSSERLDAYRDIERDFSRTCKAGLAGSEPWDAAVFGSSRVDIGINPLSPGFGAWKTVNLGLNAGLLDENKAAFDYFMDQQDSPKLVLFFVDAGDLTMPSNRNGQGLGDFATSPLNPGSAGVERILRYHFGVSALASSVSTLRRAMGQQPATYSPRGFREVAERLEHPRQQISGLYLSTIVRMARTRSSYDNVDPRKMEQLREVISRCREKNTQLIFVMPPNHALFQIAFKEIGGTDPLFLRDRRELAELAAEANRIAPTAKPVRFWDFQDGHPLNTEVLPSEGQMKNWIDLFHFTPDVGEEMLAAMLEGRSDYGTMLSPDRVSEHVETIRSDLDRWSAEHPENLSFLRESLKNFE